VDPDEQGLRRVEVAHGHGDGVLGIVSAFAGEAVDAEMAVLRGEVRLGDLADFDRVGI
jgi:hypothetical protein